MIMSNQRQFITMLDMYKDYYLQAYPEDNKHYIDKDTWNEFWKVAADVMADKLLSTGQVVLPGALGKVVIGKTKTKKKPVNWAKFRETGELHYHENSHTQGYVLKVQWLDRPFFNNQFLFGFDLSRNLKSKLAKTVQDNPNLIDSFDMIKVKGVKKY